MIASMTGYGRAVAVSDMGTMTAEIKSVNSRFLELQIRGDIPVACENAARAVVKRHLARGKVNLALTFSADGAGRQVSVTVNQSLLSAYTAALGEVASLKGVKKEKIKLRDLLALPTPFLQVTETAVDETLLLELAEEATEKAVAALVAMRETEGANLAADLSARLDFLSAKIQELNASQNDVSARYAVRLRERMKKILADIGASPDEARLLQEVAVYAEKTDYTEEIVRFESHIAQFRDILKTGGEVGRRLDFLLQELNREVNTLGSKAGECEVINEVLTLKTELEKIREQVQNLE